MFHAFPKCETFGRPNPSNPLRRCYDFCGHYDWTFEWLRCEGGEPLVRRYWEEAIGNDSQRHAAALIATKGFEGMKEYWTHTLAEEAAGYTVSEKPGIVRIDMHECPSKGFLLRNSLKAYHDYCDHCMGWIGPVMKKAGLVIYHEHNHCGKCWWEFRRREDPSLASEPVKVLGSSDVRKRPDWEGPGSHHDSYRGATDPDDKVPPDGCR
jgi:hypothetical protein